MLVFFIADYYYFNDEGFKRQEIALILIQDEKVKHD